MTRLINQTLFLTPGQDLVGKYRADFDVGGDIRRNPANFLYFTIGHNLASILNYKYVHARFLASVVAARCFGIKSAKFFEIIFGYI